MSLCRRWGLAGETVDEAALERAMLLRTFQPRAAGGRARIAARLEVLAAAEWWVLCRETGAGSPASDSRQGGEMCTLLEVC